MGEGDGLKVVMYEVSRIAGAHRAFLRAGYMRIPRSQVCWENPPCEPTGELPPRVPAGGSAYGDGWLSLSE